MSTPLVVEFTSKHSCLVERGSDHKKGEQEEGARRTTSSSRSRKSASWNLERGMRIEAGEGGEDGGDRHEKTRVDRERNREEVKRDERRCSLRISKKTKKTGSYNELHFLDRESQLGELGRGERRTR